MAFDKKIISLDRMRAYNVKINLRCWIKLSNYDCIKGLEKWYFKHKVYNWDKYWFGLAKLEKSQSSKLIISLVDKNNKT